jgi:hypothetical protein
MADVRLPPAAFAAKTGDRGFRQWIEKGMLQRIMEADDGHLIGACRYEGAKAAGRGTTDIVYSERSTIKHKLGS